MSSLYEITAIFTEIRRSIDHLESVIKPGDNHKETQENNPDPNLIFTPFANPKHVGIRGYYYM